MFDFEFIIYFYLFKFFNIKKHISFTYNEYKYSKLLTIDKNTSIELEDNNFHKSKNNIEDKSAAILPMNFTQAGFNPRKNKYTNNNWSKNNQEEYKNKGDNKNEEKEKKNDDNDDEFYLFTYYKN